LGPNHDVTPKIYYISLKTYNLNAIFAKLVRTDSEKIETVLHFGNIGNSLWYMACRTCNIKSWWKYSETR